MYNEQLNNEISIVQNHTFADNEIIIMHFNTISVSK